MSDELNVDYLRRECEGLDTEPLLRYFLQRFNGRIVLASSMAAEDQVLTDMICGINPETQIFTLDTGRLPQETYDIIEKTQRRYGISIRMLFPDAAEVEHITTHGPNSFRNSVEHRKACCYVRKVRPLRRALETADVWICGMRREQSPTREQLEPIQWDGQFGLIKLSPLADWTTEQVWTYIKLHNVPYNALHDKGYTSIGCAPCTRPVSDSEDIRAGRWWWESPQHKECGLHLNTDSALMQGTQHG